MGQVIEMTNGVLLVQKDILATVYQKDGEAGQPAPMAAILNTGEVDHDGDVVHQRRNKRGAGWVVDHFNKSPLITWQHDTWVPNLSSPDTRAKVVKHEEVGHALTLDPFGFDMGDPAAEFLDGKYRRKSLRELSAGFKGLIVDRRYEAETMVGREFFEQELIEAACANRGASRGTAALLKSMLRRPGLAKTVESGEDPESVELGEEIADLTSRVITLETAIKILGDRDEEIAVQANEAQRARAKAARDLYQRLEKLGTAHE